MLFYAAGPLMPGNGGADMVRELITPRGTDDLQTRRWSKPDSNLRSLRWPKMKPVQPGTRKGPQVTATPVIPLAYDRVS
jgi:hypothetical protein